MSNTKETRLALSFPNLCSDLSCDHPPAFGRVRRRTRPSGPNPGPNGLKFGGGACKHVVYQWLKFHNEYRKFSPNFLLASIFFIIILSKTLESKLKKKKALIFYLETSC
jgi:hypothetical protein